MRSPEEFNFLDPKTVEDPYPFYASLRDSSPVYQVPGTNIYLVSKRHLIEEALERQDDFSANLTGVLICGRNEPSINRHISFGEGNPTHKERTQWHGLGRKTSHSATLLKSCP